MSYTIYPTRKFIKSFKKLPKNIQQLAIKKDKLFRYNIHHSSLKTHQLKGRLRDYWSYWVSREYRIVFKVVNKNTVVYHEIGTHGIYK